MLPPELSQLSWDVFGDKLLPVSDWIRNQDRSQLRKLPLELAQAIHFSSGQSVMEN